MLDPDRNQNVVLLEYQHPYEQQHTLDTDAFWYVRYKLCGDHLAMSGVYCTGSTLSISIIHIYASSITSSAEFNLDIL